MSIIYNGTTLEKMVLDGIPIKKVVYDGVTVFQDKLTILPGTDKFTLYSQGRRGINKDTTMFNCYATYNADCIGYVTSDFTVDVTDWNYIYITWSCDKIWNTVDSNWNWYNFGITSTRITSYNNQSFVRSMGKVSSTGSFNKKIDVRDLSGNYYLGFYCGTANLIVSGIYLSSE